MPSQCPNCLSTQIAIAREVEVLQTRIKTQLVHCCNCDFLYLENPHWLEKAYRHGFLGDTGYVQRNLEQARFTRLLMLCHDFISKQKKCIRACDLGTGIGLFPRIMRDYGYDFWGTDQFSDMQLIKPYINPVFKSEICTSFEVVEHIQSLTDFMLKNIMDSEIFLFSTLLRDDREIPSNDWWYYAFKLGQHISFHSRESILHALKVCNAPSSKLISINKGLHAVLLTSEFYQSLKLAQAIYRHRLLRPLEMLLKRQYSRPSLTMSDHLHVISLPS